jgi:ADP-ribosyl-[dinitrogen reductase] hydrolase
MAIRAAATGGEWSPTSISESLPDSLVKDHLLRADSVGSSGFAPETVARALVVAARIVSDGFEPSLYAMNEIGGDTDTIGSIAGQIAGAALGADALPLHLLDRVSHREDVRRIADEFARYGVITNARPWP